MKSPLAWMDVVGTDFPRCIAFYTELFEWTSTEVNDEGYRFLSAGDEVVAGAEAIGPEKGPSRWTVFVQSPDIDVTVTLVEQHGGRITFPPETMGKQGRIAMIEDPAGATMGIWEAGAHNPAKVERGAGRIGGGALTTPDPSAVSPFYAACFGWTFTGPPQAPQVDAAGVPASMTIGTDVGWIPVLLAEELEPTVSRAQRFGAVVTTTETDRMVLVTDPLGARFRMRGQAETVQTLSREASTVRLAARSGDASRTQQEE